MMTTQDTRRGCVGTSMKWVLDHVTYDKDYCLIWPFSKVGGYGNLGYDGKMLYAHRVMCELVHGPAPEGKPHAAHSCGNGHKGCVNPQHLSWKSVSENQKDRRQHGTHLGAVGSRTDLTENQVAQIRALRGVKSQAEVAKLFGVKRGCIQYWQRTNHAPAPPGQSLSSVYRRQKRFK